jgi:asparagine synthetase B (glutamine-hydrolysing)
VDIVNFIEILPVILKHFPTPQYNLWTWLIFDRAHRDGVSSMYVGEGSDEIFGYDTRSYLHGWTGQLAFVWPAWLNSAKAFDIHLRAPFMSLEPSLDFRKGLPPNTQYFDPFEKKLLRDQYKDILPSFVLNRPSIPPSGPFYALVARELKMVGADLDAIKIALQKEAAKAWLEAHK